MHAGFLSSQTFGAAGGQYESDLVRLSTYSSHLSRFKNWSVLSLVKDGFYNRRKSSEIQCYSCGYQFDFDKDPGNPIDAHKLRCPSCPHIQLQNSSLGLTGYHTREDVDSCQRNRRALPQSDGEVGVHRNSSILNAPHSPHHESPGRDTVQSRKSHNTSQSDAEVNGLACTLSRNTIGPNPFNRKRDETTNGNSMKDRVEDVESAKRGSRMPTDKVLPITDNRLELCRLQSFHRWPQNAAVSPEELANAGFFYTGSDDRVQCAFCKGVLRCWEHGDKPLAEHLRHFPDCPFLEDPASMGNVQLGEENDAMLATVQMRNMASDASSLSGIMMDRPVNPRYANIAERLSSFTDFPSNSFQKPEALAHTGLYYTGQIDAVRCFFCNVLLQNWQAQSDPWVQHIKANSKCGFVRMNKGEEFIKEVLENTHKPWKHQNSNEAKKSTGTRHKVSQKQLNHIMSSSMVKSVIEMGSYSEDLIRNVVQNRLEELGDQFPNAESLGDAVYEYMEELEQVAEHDKEAKKAEETKINKPAKATRTMDSLPDPDALFESSKESFVCKVCLDKTASIVFLKCGHLVCCSSCAPELTKCPICREQILGTICVDM